MMTPHPIYRVYVAEPLFGRQRKHTVMIYRVGADSATEAIAAVEAHIVAERAHKGLRIVACTPFGRSDAIVTDGAIHWTPEKLADVENLRLTPPVT